MLSCNESWMKTVLSFQKISFLFYCLQKKHNFCFSNLDRLIDQQDYFSEMDSAQIQALHTIDDDFEDFSDKEEEEDAVCEDIDDEESFVSDDWSFDLFKNEDWNDMQKQKLFESITKCRNLIKMTKQSTVLSSYIDRLRTNLKVTRGLSNDCPTRWNSTFYLIESVIILKNLITKLFGDRNLLGIRQGLSNKLAAMELKRNDWLLLLDLYTVLKPFQLATKLMSGKQYPTIGLCYYAINKLHGFLTDNRSDSDSIKSLKRLLFAEFHRYFYSDENQLKLLQVIGILQNSFIPMTVSEVLV